MDDLMETILWKICMDDLMETILWKICMDNLMENYTLDQIDGNYTLEKLVWTILWKKGARLDKFADAKNVWRTARYVWNNYLCERESYCEAKRSKYDSQLTIQIYGTTLWCDKCKQTK